MRKNEKTAMNRLESVSATDWVRYVAQSSVGGDQSKGHRQRGHGRDADRGLA